MNLLADPLIGVSLDNREVRRLSLPEIYAMLVRDRILSFPALRPHQRHGWHAFLAQLAVLAMCKGEHSDPPENAEEWLNLLRGLTWEYPHDEPWRLAVSDVSLPAFMQCPSPNGLEEYKGQITAPDDLDILVTSKNHEVKQGIADSHTAEDWIFALITLQTMSGFLGAGNYGIARMNGGFSARSCLGLAPCQGNPGAHLFCDVKRMLASRNTLLDDYEDYYKPVDGDALLWLPPWDGTHTLSLADLDPYFIEICRRVRLQPQGGRFIAYTAPSKKSRIDAKAAKGDIGDFWAPINENSTAFSVSSDGFSYKKLVDLIIRNRGKYKLPLAMDPGDEKQTEWRLIARSIAGGQGKTEGYHERVDIVWKKKTVMLFGTDENNDLADIANKQMEEIDEITRALRDAIAVAASGGKERDLSKTDRSYAKPYVQRFDRAVDEQFFLRLEERFLAEDEDEKKQKRAEFARSMKDTAKQLLDEAIMAVPCTAIRRHLAQAKAEDTFRRCLHRKNGIFSDQPDIFKKETNNAT